MIFHETKLEGCYVIEPHHAHDERGFFARVFDAQEFEKQGLDPRIAQNSISYSEKRGTLRGLHYQEAPHQESKLIRCIRGRIFDAAVDLRTASSTYLDWVGVELDEADRSALYVPSGCAHGFITMEASTEVHYQISVPHRPEAARGLRWDDPVLGIDWPDVGALTIDVKDRAWPLLSGADGR